MRKLAAGPISRKFIAAAAAALAFLGAAVAPARAEPVRNIVLVHGAFAGMDREGALLLETPAGPRRIVSGELLGRAA